MKIALIRHMMDQPQGGARLVAMLARDLVQLGADVTLYCHTYAPEQCFPDLLSGVSVRSVHEVTTPAYRPAAESGVARQVAQLRRYFLEAPRLATLIERGTDVINPHEWLAHRSAALASRRLGAPVVWTFNDPSGWHLHRGWTMREWPHRLFDAIDTPQINRFAVIAVLSPRVGAIAERVFAAPVRVVPCGIDAHAAQGSPRAADTAPSGELRVLCVGLVAPWRRYEDAVTAVRLAREQGVSCHLTIVGSDRYWPEYAQSLRQFVRDSGRGDAITLQFESVTDADLEEAYARADVALFPNEQQAWGLAQLEAIARGVPAIVSRGAGVSDVLTDGEHCILVPARDAGAIAQGLVRLARSPGLRRQLADAGRRHVLSSLTSMHYAREMLELFRASARRTASPVGRS